MLPDYKTDPSRSWILGALASFSDINEPLVKPTQLVLDRIVAAVPLHGRFINTLSLLEHIGSYKIMATRHFVGADQATLQHIAEEAYHAAFMKRHAEKTTGRRMSYVDDDLLAPASARMYFMRLESSIVKTIAHQHDSKISYLYMSLIVEFRALWFYKIYQQTLDRAGHRMSLKRLLGQEQRHLTEMAHCLKTVDQLNDARIQRFLGLESSLYRGLLGAIQGAVARQAVNIA